ncbi:MAG: cupin domain-containing protein [Anaerolineales bacterium]|nr:cupin domain-containing protein [Anaerolineales bacterium]
MSELYFLDTKSKAVFAPDGPKPQFIFDAPAFKALVVGLEAGQQIPPHPAGSAMYHFLEGEGVMTVDDETFAVQAGATVIAPNGAKRGINAKTRIVFLAAKSGE